MTKSHIRQSIPEVRQQYGAALHAIEWFFTLLFTVEYALRLLSVDRPLRYAASFFGIVDLLAFLPTYLAALFPWAQSLLVLRAVRLLRVFRILKLARFLEDAEQLLRALRASRRKITVFFGGLLTVVLIMGTLMYLIEGEARSPGLARFGCAASCRPRARPDTSGPGR